MPRKKKVYTPKDGEKIYAAGYASVIEEKKAPSQAVRFLFWAIAIAAVTGLILWLLGVFAPKAQATSSPCQMYCDRYWPNGTCRDWDWRLCHHNPSHNETLEFNDWNACDNHAGTPHSNGAYDTFGACPAVTPTATPTQTPTPTPTDIPQQCEIETWSCQSCQDKPADDVCYEQFTGYCGKNYGCGWVSECPETNGLLKTLDFVECPMVWKCEDTCEEPEPTPTPEPRGGGNPPTFAGSSTEPPVCPDGNTSSLVANFHVVRAGSDATVNFFITEGDSANLYYKEAGQSGWTHSVMDLKPNADRFVSYTVKELDPMLGYDFGAQQKVGCGGGQIATSVVVDGPVTQTFGFSYWIW